VNPAKMNTGSLTVTVYDVPADVSASLTPSQAGGAATVTTTAVGQNAAATFSGSAGQRVYVNLSADSMGVANAATTVFLQKPDGSNLANTSALAGASPAGAIDTTVLPVSGTYTLFVNPAKMNTGSLTLTVYDVPADVSASVTPTQAGGAATVTTSAVGQNAAVTFSGTTGQRVYVNFTSDSIGSAGTQTTVTLQKPDGSFLATAGGKPGRFDRYDNAPGHWDIRAVYRPLTDDDGQPDRDGL
jgi:hypothetical protein